MNTEPNNEAAGNEPQDGTAGGVLIACWRPGWHELDQPVAVGEEDVFEFFDREPVGFVDAGSFDLVFFNQISSKTPTRKLKAKVDSISHPELGPLKRIDTCGLDYIFVRNEGSEIVVDAEENPGRATGDSVTIADWTVTVTLSQVGNVDEEVA